jgi:hypothetical protein
VAEKLERNTEKDTLSRALTIIDPSETLVPGTDECESIKNLILRWIDECGSDFALDMARMAKNTWTGG